MLKFNHYKGDDERPVSILMSHRESMWVRDGLIKNAEFTF